jgi:signal transduction histidine kinase/CheY-like chemotaxis protein
MIHAIPSQIKNGLLFDGICLDVTAEAEAEERLRIVAEIVDFAPYGALVYELRENERLVLASANRSADRVLGVQCRQRIGLTIEQVFPALAQTDLPETFRRVATQGERFNEEVAYQDETIHGIFDMHALQIAPNRIAVFFVDITEGKRLRTQLFQSQKMEAIGQLAGGVAHDFNNILTGILGYANLLKMQSPSESLAFEAGKTIERAAERALTRQLLGFARKGKNLSLPVDMHDIIWEIVNLLSRTIDKKIQLMQHLHAESPIVLGDPNQLQQVILNLTVNARDAMPDGGKLSLATDTTYLDDNYCRTHLGVHPGHYLAITVSDSGCGIPKEIQDRVFEPFFTTKLSGKGTGMGLAMVYGIVENHKGFIQLHSEIGKGTSFKIYLPLSIDPVQLKPSQDLGKPTSGKGRVLFVDDEPVVRAVAGEMLKGLGYKVVSCVNGREALEYYRVHAAEVDLTILDMIMPEMGGPECFLEMKRINPKIKAILSTGYGFDGQASQAVNEGMVGFIQKPYKLSEFSIAIAKAMNK